MFVFLKRIKLLDRGIRNSRVTSDTKCGLFSSIRHGLIFLYLMLEKYQFRTLTGKIIPLFFVCNNQIRISSTKFKE